MVVHHNQILLLQYQLGFFDFLNYHHLVVLLLYYFHLYLHYFLSLLQLYFLERYYLKLIRFGDVIHHVTILILSLLQLYFLVRYYPKLIRFGDVLHHVTILTLLKLMQYICSKIINEYRKKNIKKILKEIIFNFTCSVCSFGSK